MSKKEEIRFIENKYKNWSSINFEHEDGEFYPKEIDIPKIESIQYPEPHIRITDSYEKPEEWYEIYTLIEPFAEQAFLCYTKGYWHASIACCINCCECILKYEYLRKIAREDAKKKIQSMTLGFFTGQNNTNLTKLRIRIKFQSRLNYLNNVRIGLYHFNPKKIKKIGNTFIEKNFNSITSELIIPIVAYKTYCIMQDLINHFYNDRMRIKHNKDSLIDYENLRRLKNDN